MEGEGEEVMWGKSGERILTSVSAATGRESTKGLDVCRPHPLTEAI